MSSGEPLLDALPARVPLFPLAGVQLFPRALLPLHVFEPRYRALVRDSLEESRLIAIPSVLDGADESGRILLNPVCGVGRIIAHEPLPDGRSHILLQGVARARIVEEFEVSTPYRVARLAVLPDEQVAPEELGALEARSLTLRLLVEQVAGLLPDAGRTLRELTRMYPEAAGLSDVLAAALLVEPEARQRLLEERSVDTRTELLIEYVGALLAHFAERKGPAN